MEFPYISTILYKNVVFYVSTTGNKAYFVGGGCVYAASRPSPSGECEPLLKFGMTVPEYGSEGLGGKALGDYVSSEMRRRGLRGGTTSFDGTHAFVDCLEFLNHDPSCNERTLCGRFDVHVRDPAIAEHVVGMGVTAGLLITAVVDRPENRLLRMLCPPAVSNAYSGFEYEPSPDAFRLVQAVVPEPPDCLTELVAGLFDGIPAPRKGFDDRDVPDRIDVVVLGPRSARTITLAPAGQSAETSSAPTSALKASASQPKTYKPAPACSFQTAALSGPKSRFPGRGAKPAKKKNARICDYVQVRFIAPTLNVWAPTEDHLRAQTRRDTPRRLLGDLTSAFYCVTRAIDPSAQPWPGMSDELYDAREKIWAAATTVFGRGGLQFVPPWKESDLSPVQKLLVFQYVQALYELPSCYGFMLDLCEGYRFHSDAFVEDSGGRGEADRVADITAECFRACLFLGAAAEIVAVADHRTVNFLKSQLSSSPSTDACMDADMLLDLAACLTEDEATVCAERDARLVKLAAVLHAVYSAEPVITAAARESKTIGNSELLCVAIDIVSTCAFQKCPRLKCLGVYANALFDNRLKEAQLPSYYE